MTLMKTKLNTKDNFTRLSVLSLNINGLSDDKKRNNLYEKIINKNIDITLTQETHSTRQNIDKWEKEWAGKSFWHSGKVPESSGVAILIKQNLNIETHTISKDEEGRIISLTLTFENQNFQIINIYGPMKNSEKHTFYKERHKYITQEDNMILGGDFNMVEDLLLDRQGGNPNATRTLGLNPLTKIKQKYYYRQTFGRKKTQINIFSCIITNFNKYIAELTASTYYKIKKLKRPL